MKAIKILKKYQDEIQTAIPSDIDLCEVIDEIEEVEAYITNYQGMKRRLDSTIITLAVLENEKKSLVKTLIKMDEEMIELRKENQDLKESNKELLEGLISTQKRLEKWLEKCN
ncbi:hypothetical protein N5T79_06445 [Aliarcobacter cryaerophilus]|uniref:hypothetical protein n=1 Tax=Aliarcobacter cryaerophilus TaxID=28198 RepID=UPI0021B687AA|nr:hypothetical protein [Aliarcobacter cryaerophilus]MCT7528781.1 hypothetical protein [Aliarcobacter cryaerophilus]